MIDWDARRDDIEAALSKATGTAVRTDGHIAVRLLPSPRIRIDGLRVGQPGDLGPSLLAQFVKGEVALTPLLSGKVRVTEMRVGRAEIRAPVGTDPRIVRDFAGDASRQREWALEDLFIGQLLVTSVAPATGRTNQIYAENVHIESQSLAGPWRVEGTSAAVPFCLATGSLGPDQTLSVKLSGGGDVHPRFEVDAKLDLSDATGSAPAMTGNARVLFGPPAQVAAAGVPIPVIAQAKFKTVPGAVELDPVTIEAAEGGASLRMTGSGVVTTGPDLAVSLKLEGRRLDLDSFILSGQGRGFAEGWKAWRVPVLNTPVDLDIALSSITLGQEEIANARFRGVVRHGRTEVGRVEAT